MATSTISNPADGAEDAAAGPGDDAGAGADGPAGLDSFYTPAEVARLFRRSPRTIRDWVGRGYLTPVRIGPAVYFRRAEIDRMADE